MFTNAENQKAASDESIEKSAYGDMDRETNVMTQGNGKMDPSCVSPYLASAKEDVSPEIALDRLRQR